MPFNNRVKEARKNRGLTQEQLGKLIGVAKSTITGYEKGTSQPDKTKLIALMNALEVDANYLWQDSINSKSDDLTMAEQAHMEKYRTCDNRGKGTVDAVLNIEYARCTNSKTQAFIPPAEDIELPIYNEPAAAGYGNYLSDSGYDMRMFPKSEVPPGTDFCIWIEGDSMEEAYHDGDLVFVKSAPVIDSGQIGIFIINDSSYCKKLVIDHRNRMTKLVSLNQEYEDIVITEFDDLRTVGRVLGVADLDT
jgi:repressor LexA